MVTPANPSVDTAVAELSLEQKREMLRQLLKQKQAAKPAQKGALSYAQQRLWFLYQMEGPSSTYNMKFALRLQGALSLPLLERALKGLIERHDSLRTSFPETDGDPVQVVNPDLAPELTLVDLQHLPAEQRRATMERLAESESAMPFRLEDPSLMRVRLLRLDHDQHVFLLTLHHIISDGWSMAVFVAELVAMYEGFYKNEKPALSDLPLSYLQYAEEQRQHLQGEVLQKQLDYWRGQLGDVSEVLELPFDQPKQQTQSQRGEKLSFEINADLCQRLREQSRRSKTTLFTTLLSIYAVLLARYSGQKDIIIGSPNANRRRGDIRSIIGLFVNTLVLRVRLDDEPGFKTLIERVHGTVRDSMAHQDLPFEKLVAELQPERRTNTHPIFQVMFALQAERHKTFNLPALTIEHMETVTKSAKFELNMGLFPNEQGLEGYLEFNRDLFEPETAKAITRHFAHLAGRLLDQPESSVMSHGLLTDAERQLVLEQFNNTNQDYGPETTLPALYAARVKAHPQRTAVVFEDDSLSYEELDQRAEVLAKRLVSKGVGPEKTVAVCLHRSLDMVIALYGIHKAGAAYLPLDPDYPVDRLEYMLEDGRPAALILADETRALLPNAGITALTVAGDHAGLEGIILPNPLPDHQAYTIYTSGSTGKPKGATNTHRAICNRLMWMQDAFQLNETDHVLHKTPFSFDVSVWELFWPLLYGARLVVARPGGHSDSQFLAALIRDAQITTLHFVPSMLRAFLEEEGLETIKDLRRVICSGEALDLQLQERFFQKLPSAQLHNLYGPTEAAIDVSWWQCLDGEPIVPIGKSIANTQLHVFNEKGSLQPPGLPGELVIGGVQLARGYHRRPALTAERFVPNPYGASGERLYRTGDLVRYRRDGNILYMGRLDHQVKLRGFRIELGEIEAALTASTLVDEAVVIVHRFSDFDTALVAYITHPGREQPANAALKLELAKNLPDYMIPNTFVSQERLPLSANGKLDRKALPKPAAAAPTAHHVPPTTAMEIALAEIWKELLHVERVGVNDNFFNAGGHSLLLVRIRQLVESRLGHKLTMLDLFKMPTISDLARFLEQGSSQPKNFSDSRKRAQQKKKAFAKRNRRRRP